MAPKPRNAGVLSTSCTFKRPADWTTTPVRISCLMKSIIHNHIQDTHKENEIQSHLEPLRVHLYFIGVETMGTSATPPSPPVLPLFPFYFQNYNPNKAAGPGPGSFGPMSEKETTATGICPTGAGITRILSVRDVPCWILMWLLNLAHSPQKWVWFF